ncbi:MAG: DHHA1 domain-containing protein [archaeon]
MITTPQLKNIKELLEKSQNPLFFFDNDVDGLCSFLIIQRSLGRGKGVSIKSFPELTKSYARKIDELNPDVVIILDKPRVSSEFIKEVEEKSIPIIWIDHHDVPIEEEIMEKVHYFNSFDKKTGKSEPTTYIAQRIFNREEDLWLAMIGCIGDVYMPDFAEEFSEENPEIFPKKETGSAFNSLYTTDIGKIVRMLNFGLMDTTTNVIHLIKYLSQAKNAHDVLEENQYTRQMHKKYKEYNTFLNKQVDKAEANMDKNKHLLFFSYSGTISMSSEISNKLYFKHPSKTVVVAYNNEYQGKINISIRGKNAKDITEKAIQNIEGASGGGHKEATGAMVPMDNLEEFKERVEELTK